MMQSATPSFDQILNELVLARQEHSGLLQFGSIVSAHQYLRAYDLVTRHVPKNGAVLDWGCGNGHFSYFLIRSGYQTSGMNFAGVPPICQLFHPDQYTYKDADDRVGIPYESGTFDAVTSIGVLEHVRETGGNEPDSLKEIYRLLKPGGVFVCFHLPNQYSWIEKSIRVSKRFTSKMRYAHTYRYTSKQIIELSEEAGFDVIEMKRYAALPRNIWWWAMKYKRIAESRTVATIYDRFDDLLAVPLSPICQCYLYVAKKPLDSGIE